MVLDSVVARSEVTALALDRSRGGCVRGYRGERRRLGWRRPDAFRLNDTATAESRGGDAAASSGAALGLGRIVDGVVMGNFVRAIAPRGRARPAAVASTSTSSP